MLILIMILLNFMRIIDLMEDIPFNIALSDILIPVVGLMILIRLIAERSFKGVEYLGFFVLLLTWLVITNILADKNEQLTSASWMTIYGEWVKTALCIAYFYIGYQVLHYMSYQRLLRFYALGYSVFLAYGFASIIANNQGIDLPFMTENSKQFFLGTYTDPNHAATYLTISFFLLLYGMHIDRNRLIQGLYILLGLCTFGALFLADSRGGLLGFGVALVVYVLIAYYDRLSSVITFLFALLSALFVSMIFDANVNNGLFISKLFNSFLNFNSGLDIRESLSATALQMGKEHWLLGVGRGNYIVNAPSYFEQLNLPYIDNIPHNTYIGLFAEVGIVGLLLYMIPVWLILYGVYKNRKVIIMNWNTNRLYITTLIAIAFGVGIQAYVLNVENRRVLWFIGGFVVYSIVEGLANLYNQPNDAIVDKITVSKKSVKWHSIINVILMLGTLLIFFYTVNSVYFPMKNKDFYSDYRQELTIPDVYVGEPLEVEFYLYAHQSGFTEQDTVEIKVIEVFNTGESEVLKSFVYPRTNGTCRLEFVKGSTESKVYFEAIKISGELNFYSLGLKRLISQKDVLYLNHNYYLVDSNKRNQLLYKKWEPKKEVQYNAKTFTPNLSDFDTAVFGSLFKVTDIVFDNEGKNSSVIVNYEALETITEDYNIWLYGNPDNLHNLDISRFSANYEYYNPVEPIQTSTWIKGNSYQVTYPFPRNKGWYRLFGGINIKKDDETIRLVDETTKKNYVIFGWFNAE